MFDRSRYTSYANDTKWSELQQAMVSLGARAPRFRVKTLNLPEDSNSDSEWYYHFRSDYVWKEMEWVDLVLRQSPDAASLDEVASICRRVGFEIESHHDFVRVVGHYKHGRT